LDEETKRAMKAPRCGVSVILNLNSIFKLKKSVKVPDSFKADFNTELRRFKTGKLMKA
jgi:hypothetical protein